MSYSRVRPTARSPRRFRDGLAITLALLVAALAAGGGYALANRSRLPFSLPFAAPTPVPTLRALDALNEIQRLYPSAFVHVTSPIAGEVDLQTDTTDAVATPLTAPFATKILAIYLRGYASQTFWRWIDKDSGNRQTTVFEVHSAELWVLATNTLTCQTTWTVYPLTAAQIIARGSSGGDYTSGVAARPGVGRPPATFADC